MTDREKIINALERAKAQSEEYDQDRIIVPFKELDLILALLRGHETVNAPQIQQHTCGALIVNRGRNVCPNCGKRVKWDD